MLKQIYSFKTSKLQEVEEISKKIETDEEGKEQEVEVKKKVSKEVPVEVIIKKPSRRQIEEAETQFSIEMSKGIKKGILTKAMMAKKYADTGGALTEKDSQDLLSLYKKLGDLENEIVKMSIAGIDKNKEETKEKAANLNGELAQVKKDIIDIESSYRTIFNHTADVKAQNVMFLWYVLNLTYYKSLALDIPEPKLFFQGETFEEKAESYYKMEEEDDELFLKIVGKASSVLSYWYYSQGNFDEKDLDLLFADQEESNEQQSES